MKNNLLALVLTCLSFVVAKAETFVVQVANFQFTPATVNAVVGDTIQWVWVDGNHTTTSTSVPAGAATWDTAMDADDTSFIYVLQVAGTYDYVCVPHQPGMAGTIVATGSLPVQLINFAVSNTNNNKALVSWNTVTEQNTSYFSIKRSTDGTTFNEIGRVNAKGNSTTLQSYSYTDNSISNSDKYLYYTLEIVDKDGKKQLSDIKMFKNNAAIAKLITKLSPNPISSPGHLMLQFNADKQGKMLVQLFDANGKFVKQTKMEAVAGLNNGHFHLGNLAPGVYRILFTLEGVKETKSIVVE